MPPGRIRASAVLPGSAVRELVVLADVKPPQASCQRLLPLRLSGLPKAVRLRGVQAPATAGPVYAVTPDSTRPGTRASAPPSQNRALAERASAPLAERVSHAPVALPNAPTVSPTGTPIPAKKRAPPKICRAS